MPRRPRAVFPGLPHHVTQRGARRQIVFFEDFDRTLYLELLQEGCAKHSVSVLAYCLMTNHVHLVVVPPVEEALHLLFKQVHSKYARFVNERHKWSGHLWQSRFFSSTLDPSHFYCAVRYVELNPVRAGIVERADAYRWSSAKARVGEVVDPVLDLTNNWNCSLPESAEWATYLEDTDEEKEDFLRKCHSQNLPCGGEQFIKNLEEFSGLNLTFRPRGRPLKS